MHIVYATQDPPKTFTKSIFLVGPTPRSETGGKSWRPDMIAALQEAGYDGVIFVPEPEDGVWPSDYTDQIAWEQRYLERCDLILAWIPRNLETLPGFTTNVEFGEFLESGKMIYGRPEGAPKTRYLDVLYQTRWETPPLTTMNDMALTAVWALGAGSPRSGGERSVPLDIWQSNQFQAWYQAQTAAGNTLVDADVEATFRSGPKTIFGFLMWVDMWVKAEQRHKKNEFIFTRTDISVAVPYHVDDLGAIHIVLVREYRPAAATLDGFVHELPGGSNETPPTGIEQLDAAAEASHGLWAAVAQRGHEDVLAGARKELKEETGLNINPARFCAVACRQLASTFSTHSATVFSVALTHDELQQVKTLEATGTTRGVAEDTERTYIEVRTLDEILRSNLLDWSQIGMLLQALENVASIGHH